MLEKDHILLLKTVVIKGRFFVLCPQHKVWWHIDLHMAAV